MQARRAARRLPRASWRRPRVSVAARPTRRAQSPRTVFRWHTGSRASKCRLSRKRAPLRCVASSATALPHTRARALTTPARLSLDARARSSSRRTWMSSKRHLEPETDCASCTRSGRRRASCLSPRSVPTRATDPRSGTPCSSSLPRKMVAYVARSVHCVAAAPPHVRLLVCVTAYPTVARATFRSLLACHLHSPRHRCVLVLCTRPAAQRAQGHGVAGRRGAAVRRHRYCRARLSPARAGRLAVVARPRRFRNTVDCLHYVLALPASIRARFFSYCVAVHVFI